MGEKSGKASRILPRDVVAVCYTPSSRVLRSFGQFVFESCLLLHAARFTTCDGGAVRAVYRCCRQQIQLICEAAQLLRLSQGQVQRLGRRREQQVVGVQGEEEGTLGQLSSPRGGRRLAPPSKRRIKLLQQWYTIHSVMRFDLYKLEAPQPESTGARSVF